MPIATATLIVELDSLLDAGSFQDHGPNGLQVAGPDLITTLASATTASLDSCHQAVAARADALLVHHGLFWGQGLRSVTGPMRARLATLLGGDCALIAYHLPLDAHPIRGNNAAALQRLGLRVAGNFAAHRGRDIGLWAESDTAIPIADLAARCQTVFAHPVLHCPGGPAQVRRIGVVTGGGQGFLSEAAAVGLEALITGETSEQSWHEAAEHGVHLLACGHHATECLAVHSLAADLALHHDLHHVQIVEHNPC